MNESFVEFINRMFPEGINVLSLFDGTSTCQYSLTRLGVKINMYFASEIEKASIKVTQKNFPNTIQLGDVTKITSEFFKERGITIHFITAGSPCQDLSRMNTNGQGLEGDKSSLFFDFYRLLKEIRPPFFLLENVLMKPIWEKQITDLLSKVYPNCSVGPYLISSEHFSPQKRERLYWTNIKVDLNNLPEKNKVFKDIIYDVSNTYGLFKALPSQSSSKRITKTRYIQWDSNGKRNASQWDRSYFLDGKICTLTKVGSQNINICVDYDKDIHRKLHPIEAERLQSLPDNYTLVDDIKPSKRFEMLGNGWNSDTICFILSSNI